MDTDSVSQNSMSVERRRWTRYPSKGTAVRIKTAAVDHRAYVVNRSFGGVALDARDVEGLQVGQQVVVMYDYVGIAAVVRRIDAGDDGSYRVAVEWIAQKSFIRNVLEKVLREE